MHRYQLLTADHAQKMLETVSALTWKPGKARTETLTGTVKKNLEILAADHPAAGTLLKTVASTLIAHQDLVLHYMPIKIHMPKFNKHPEGGYYQPHTDAPWMETTRTDVACTLWLSPPDAYEGGELVVGDQSFRGQPGEALVYECGAVHAVNPVTKGERVCVITWMQSRVRDPIQRRMLTDFRKFLRKIEDCPQLFLEGSRIYSALLKRWMD